MLGAARHSQGSGEYFPTAREVAFSWSTVPGVDRPMGGIPGMRWINFGSGWPSTTAQTEYTLAYWFKFLRAPAPYNPSSGSSEEIIARPIGNSSRSSFGVYLDYTIPFFVSNAKVYGPGVAPDSPVLNLVPNVWYSLVITGRSSQAVGGSLVDIWLNGQLIWTDSGFGVSDIKLAQVVGEALPVAGNPNSPSIPTDIQQQGHGVAPDLALSELVTGSNDTKYADLHLFDYYIDFRTDINKLRYFYDYRIDGPAVSGGLSPQSAQPEYVFPEVVTNWTNKLPYDGATTFYYSPLREGNNIPYTPYPPNVYYNGLTYYVYPDPGMLIKMGGFHMMPPGVQVGNATYNSMAYASLRLDLTDTPTT